MSHLGLGCSAHGLAGDAARLDERGRALALAPAAALRASTAPETRGPGRVGADRGQRASLVRGSGSPCTLPDRAFDKDQRVTQAAIVETKRLSEVLAWIKERQDEMRPPTVKTNSEKSGDVRRGRGPTRDGTARQAVF